MKMILTLILISLVANSILSLFCPFIGTKNKNQIFSKLVVWQREIVLLFVQSTNQFLYENDLNFNSYKFSCKFNFIPFLSFHRNQKQESNFQQVGGLATRNSFTFCLVELEWRSTSKVRQNQQTFIKDCYSCLYYSSMLVVSILSVATAFYLLQRCIQNLLENL